VPNGRKIQFPSKYFTSITENSNDATNLSDVSKFSFNYIFSFCFFPPRTHLISPSLSSRAPPKPTTVMYPVTCRTMSTVEKMRVFSPHHWGRRYARSHQTVGTPSMRLHQRVLYCTAHSRCHELVGHSSPSRDTIYRILQVRTGGSVGYHPPKLETSSIPVYPVTRSLSPSTTGDVF
jgi:hypothetical protein